MKLWPDQERVAAYAAGPMAVMAVPGGGKTTALAAIAARLIAGGAGEILIVTYQNVAVTNLRRRVDEFLSDASLPPAGVPRGYPAFPSLHDPFRAWRTGRL